jgi:hypothetical protein
MMHFLCLLLFASHLAAEPFFLNQPLHFAFNGWAWGSPRKDIPNLVEAKAESGMALFSYTQKNFRFGPVQPQETSLLFHEDRLMGSVLTFKKEQEQTIGAYLQQLYGPGTPAKDGLKWEESGLVVAMSPEASAVKILFLHQGLLTRAVRNMQILALAPNQALLKGVQFGEIALVRAALERGAKVEIDKSPNALFLAAEGGHAEIFHLVFATVEKTPPVLSGSLRAALSSGNPAIVKSILDAGANPNAEELRAETPLLTAVRAPFAKREIIEILVKAGARMDHRDDSGQNALHHAAWANNTRLLGLLQSSGLDVNARDNAGRTPLICAAEEGHVESVRELLRLGARSDVRDTRGQTVLQRVDANLKGRLVLYKHRHEQVLDVLRGAKK